MKKIKVLLLSDDIRVMSGIGTMSRAFVMGTLDKYDWVQVAGAMKHPEQGKVIDFSSEAQKESGVADASVKLYPVDGYGSQQVLRDVIELEKPDAILHFTDPRFWDWLYAMEHEVRQQIPIMYYNIWDDLPFPHWNEPFYDCCDSLIAISKQTYNINKEVCRRKPRIEGLDLTYVPHGIDETMFTPVDQSAKEFLDFKSKVLSGKEYDFVALFNSRNITRKHPADLISAFAKFASDLPEVDSKKVALVLHTDPVDQNGTDLYAVAKNLAPNVNVIFSSGKMDAKSLNYLYNMADVMCNPSSAEGFGLTHMEAMMSGTPTIASVIGGLQDQMGFVSNGEPLSVKDFTASIPSNSTGLISTDHGPWVYPLWPQITLQGSPKTPYIYDSRVSTKSIVAGLSYWYKKSSQIRSESGLIGRKWAIKNGFTSKSMCAEMIKSIDGCLKYWQPRQQFELIDTNKNSVTYKSGVLI